MTVSHRKHYSSPLKLHTYNSTHSGHRVPPHMFERWRFKTQQLHYRHHRGVWYYVHIERGGDGIVFIQTSNTTAADTDASAHTLSFTSLRISR